MLWYSGYHICLPHRRSPVQILATTYSFFTYFCRFCHLNCRKTKTTRFFAILCTWQLKQLLKTTQGDLEGLKSSISFIKNQHLTQVRPENSTELQRTIFGYVFPYQMAGFCTKNSKNFQPNFHYSKNYCGLGLKPSFNFQCQKGSIICLYVWFKNQAFFKHIGFFSGPQNRVNQGNKIQNLILLVIEVFRGSRKARKVVAYLNQFYHLLFSGSEQ